MQILIVNKLFMLTILNVCNRSSMSWKNVYLVKNGNDCIINNGKVFSFLIVFFQAEDGMTVLHYAAKAGYVDVLMTLLESDDADVNMQVSAIVVNKSIEKTLSTSFKQSSISDIEVWYSVEVLFDDSIG